jgi:L-fuculose-phosphate aldolase
MLEREREQVAEASRRLAAGGLVIGTAGNVSARVKDRVAISPTGAVLSTLTAEQVAVVDLEGHQHDGELEPTSELDLHLGLYRRFDAGGVVHTHAPYATALACVLDDEVPLVHYGLLALGGPVRVAPYATFGTPELAQATLAALQDRTAVLMASHGTLAYGGDVHQAVANTELLEWGCELYWRAAAVGTPRALDEQQRADVLEAVRERRYGTTRARGDSR